MKKQKKRQYCAANFASSLFPNFIFSMVKMDEFNYFQFLNDGSELLEAKDLLLGEFPTFSVQFDEYFDDFSLTSAPDLCDPESSNKETTNPESTQEEDSSRFPVISSEAIEELKAV